MIISLVVSSCCLWAGLVSILSVQASPIYPAYADFAPVVMPVGYGAGLYPVVPAGGYYGTPVHHHSTGGRYSGQESYSEKSIDYQKDNKYYYGGQYKGSCLDDGLYYKDDTTFVMCSNGYPHAQPCPPGTKTSGSPSYKPGYYYGYTDLCSVNLVDYGLGPEHYAPAGPPEDEKTGHHSRGVSSKKVEYSSSGFDGAHGRERHVSKDVYSQQGRVGEYGGQVQNQHLHVEKHKAEGHHGGEYNKQVVKQGEVASYSQAHHPSHYNLPGPYGVPEHVATSHQSFHKEKQHEVGYQAQGYPHHGLHPQQQHSQQVIKSHSVSSDVALHAGGHHGGYGAPYVPGQYPGHEKVKERVETTYQNSASVGSDGSVEKSHQHSQANSYVQYGGSQYPHPPSNIPAPYAY